MLAATLAAFPPYRLNGDEATVQRIIRRPNSALEVGGNGAVGVGEPLGQCCKKLAAPDRMRSA